jgi:hypothetical protein
MAKRVSVWFSFLDRLGEQPNLLIVLGEHYG